MGFNDVVFFVWVYIFQYIPFFFASENKSFRSRSWFLVWFDSMIVCSLKQKLFINKWLRTYLWLKNI